MNYKQSYFENKTWLPINLVRKAITEGFENSLHYLIILKQTQKPIIYNYSIRRLASDLKCSPTTLSCHIKILAHRGCIKVTDGNMVLSGSNNLTKTYKSILVAVKHGATRQEFIANLRFVLIKRNLHTQDKAIQLKQDIIKMHRSKFTPLATVKRLTKAQRKLESNNIPVEKTLRTDLILSNKKVGAICNRSQTTGIRIQKRLNDFNLVKTERNLVLIGLSDRRTFFAKELPSSYQISAKGYVNHYLPNKWFLPVQQVVNH